jgi:MinD-like ATPase involved in chromosome partitioning or flagellar assembly
LYVITFYSFKGGVGRTMALANVAAELVRRGRKVLVVDFDLEAPGLETYKHLRPPKPTPGIVEYVTEFRRTYEVPSLLDYIYEAKQIGKKGGRLWVMPAGRRDRTYRTALADLDWQRLYQRENGFVLFEDTKKGWDIELKPDYVLIDSRTGDTDVLGICTRQLPDSVVLMFTPNEQNLTGLEGVCRDIRREETEGLKKTIRLHFVAANVPDLDDEKGILRRQIRAFRERLEFKEFSGVVRRYENLSLLNQSIFTLERPHSRLARSYRRLVRTLMKDNYMDRDGAMFFLEDYAKLDPKSRPSYYKRLTAEASAVRLSDVQASGNVLMEIMLKHADFSEYDVPVQMIGTHFPNDAEVLIKLAEYCILQEEYGNALGVLDRVLELRQQLPVALFMHGLCRAKIGELREAADDLLACLDQVDQVDQDANFTRRCLTELREIAPHRLAEAAAVISAHGFPQMSRRELAEWLCDREAGISSAAQLLREDLTDLNEEEKTSEKVLQLLMRARCWKEVIQLLEAEDVETLSTTQLFCLALAHWGQDGEMPESLCRLELERGNHPQAFRTAHYCQVISWLHWRVGNKASALSFLNEAEELGRGDRACQVGTSSVRIFGGGTFSLWRYRIVSIEQFLDDCQLMRRMIEGEPLRPEFLGPAHLPEQRAASAAENLKV